MKRLKTATVLIASLAIGLLIPIGTLGTTGTASMPIAQAATGDQEKKGESLVLASPILIMY